jgi:hypothetical protein
VIGLIEPSQALEKLYWSAHLAADQFHFLEELLDLSFGLTKAR